MRLLGADTEVMCADGRARRYVNLDYAASTPRCPRCGARSRRSCPGTAASIAAAGSKSRVATEAFEGTRDVVAEFVGAPAGHDVIFVRNTTEAINVLAAALPAGRAS